VLPITDSAPLDRLIPLPPSRSRCRSNVISASMTIVRGSSSAKAMNSFDLRKLPNTDRYDYGFLPPRFFNRVLEAFADWYRIRRRRITSRE
jgi:hypothetical protein